MIIEAIGAIVAPIFSLIGKAQDGKNATNIYAMKAEDQYNTFVYGANNVDCIFLERQKTDTINACTADAKSGIGGFFTNKGNAQAKCTLEADNQFADQINQCKISLLQEQQNKPVQKSPYQSPAVIAIVGVLIFFLIYKIFKN